jgi:hypothetical protein
MDYSSHPPSIAEIRSDKTGKGSDWTPRDALIALLRDIDSGAVDLQAVFIAGKVRGTQPGGCRPVFSVSAADPTEALGTIELAKIAYGRAAHGE